MIIQEINATVNGNSLSGEVIVPSPVLTSTKQAEDGDLTKSPNFQLKLTGVTPEMNIIDTIQVEFTNGDFNYTAKMNVINTQQNGTVTLQYVDGLTVEEVDDSSDDLETYYINEAMISFCTVTIEPNPAAEGETVTVTVTPDPGNVFDSIEAQGLDTHTNITITDLGNNQYSFTMPAEDVDLSVNCISSGETNPYSLSEVIQLEDNAEFTFDGTVTVINKSSNNRELYVQDADGTAGIKMYQNNVGSSFSTGDVIYNGWTATKSVYNGVTQLSSISNLNYSGDTTTLIANELSISSFTESDTYNYYVFRNITINGNAIEDGEGNTMTIYNQFGVTIPSDAQHYDAYGVVAWYNNAAQLYPMSFELIDGGSDDDSSDDPDEPTFTYDGSDQNDPIICNVTLGDNSDIMNDISINIGVDGSFYDYEGGDRWTPYIEKGLTSDDNDTPITGNNLDGMYAGDMFFSGTRIAGTYLKSYTLTFQYDSSLGEDATAQALDGTTITFWVRYYVTDSRPAE